MSRIYYTIDDVLSSDLVGGAGAHAVVCAALSLCSLGRALVWMRLKRTGEKKRTNLGLLDGAFLKNGLDDFVIVATTELVL